MKIYPKGTPNKPVNLYAENSRDNGTHVFSQKEQRNTGMNQNYGFICMKTPVTHLSIPLLRAFS